MGGHSFHVINPLGAAVILCHHQLTATAVA